MILLSVKAGLRAREIAALARPMVTDSSGQIGHMIELPGGTGTDSDHRAPGQARHDRQ